MSRRPDSNSLRYFVFFLGDNGEVEGTVNVHTFVDWVDDTPEQYDYISQSLSQSLSCIAGIPAGINDIKYYHANLTLATIPLTLVTTGGWVVNLDR